MLKLIQKPEKINEEKVDDNQNLDGLVQQGEESCDSQSIGETTVMNLFGGF